MVFLDDVVIALGAGIATTSLVILLALLSRYQRAVDDAQKSNELAKNLFDALNARLMVQDARIVDLMARVEVYSTGKTLPSRPVVASKVVTSDSVIQSPFVPVIVSQPVSRQISHSSTASVPATESVRSVRSANTTESSILETLLEGPKASNSIREVIQVTREHNARLLKGLFDRGLVSRSEEHKPYLYQITEAGKAYLKSAQSPG